MVDVNKGYYVKNVGTWTNFCIFCFSVVGHTSTNPQEGSIVSTLDCWISHDTANTFITIVSIREEPGRTVTLVGCGERQGTHKQK